MSNEQTGSESRGWRSLLIGAGEDYVRGAIVLGISYGVWRAIELALAWVETRGLGRALVLLLMLLVVPPVLGWLVTRLLYPRMRRVRLLRAMQAGCLGTRRET